jgi:hypothetical protein
MTVTRDTQKSADGLKKRLEDYPSAARAIASRITLRQCMGNRPIYGAATGSAMAMAPCAPASTMIAYTGPPLTA